MRLIYVENVLKAGISTIRNDMTFCKDCRPEKKQANYGRQGGKPTHCSKHGKSHGFVDVVHTRCGHDGCEERTIYGVKLMTITYMYYDGAIERTETPALPAGF